MSVRWWQDFLLGVVLFWGAEFSPFGVQQIEHGALQKKIYQGKREILLPANIRGCRL